MRQVLEMYDRMMASWTYWSYDPGGWGIWEADENGEFARERDNADDLVRPYPRSVAGVPRSFSYDPDARVFDLVFDPSPSATLPTEIYVPRTRHYAPGFTLHGCDEDKGCMPSWNPDTEILEILTFDRTASVVLQITPDD